MGSRQTTNHCAGCLLRGERGRTVSRGVVEGERIQERLEEAELTVGSSRVNRAGIGDDIEIDVEPGQGFVQH